jgi:hypothetical protein
MGFPGTAREGCCAGRTTNPLLYVVTPGFIRAMGIRLRGRDFSWADTLRSERVVLINASAARVYWPNEDAVGKILMRDGEADHVIGVVDDVHQETSKVPSAHRSTTRQHSRVRLVRNW